VLKPLLGRDPRVGSWLPALLRATLNAAARLGDVVDHAAGRDQFRRAYLAGIDPFYKDGPLG
jgi:hypothetical protein